MTPTRRASAYTFLRRMAAALVAPDDAPLKATGREASRVARRLRDAMPPEMIEAIEGDDPNSRIVQVYRLGRASMARDLAAQSLRQRPGGPFMVAIADPFAQIILDALGEDEATTRAIATAVDIGLDDLQQALDVLVTAEVLDTREDEGDTLYFATAAALSLRVPLDAIEDDEVL